MRAKNILCAKILLLLQRKNIITAMKKTTKARIWFGVFAVLAVVGIAAAVKTVAGHAATATATHATMAKDSKPAYDKNINPEPLTAAPIKGERVIRRSAYTCSYNNAMRQPNYVAWTLTAARTHGKNRREPQFYEDTEIDAGSRALLSDYYNSGMSRGHMCPAADNKWSAQAMHESFLLSNICPQTLTLNGEDWEHLESFCRNYVHRRHTALHIVCGPIFTSDPPQRRQRRLYVPDKFFKAIVCLDKGAERGIAFVYGNNTERHPMDYYACTIDKVEQMTGFDLFHRLDKKMQQRIEAQSDLNAWR